METSCILTGYSNSSLSLATSEPPTDGTNFLSRVMEQYVHTSLCMPYEDDAKNLEIRTGLSTDDANGPDLSLKSSKLLQQLPWFTPLPLLLEAKEPVKELLKSLQDNFSFAQHGTDENSKAYHAVMKGEVPGASKNADTYVASRLLTFRFLDILQALDEETELDTLDQQVFRKNISVLKYNDLSNWTEVISKAQNILQSDKGENSDTGNSNPGTLTEEQRIGRELYMFVRKQEKKSQAYQIYANVGLACLGIRRLLQGRLDNPRLEEEIIAEFGEGIPGSVSEFASLSRTLELATSISPLILFTSRKLSSIHVSRTNLSKFWIEQGNIRNPKVWSVEKEIWAGLIQISQNFPVKETILGILSKISFHDLDRTTKEWFHTGVSSQPLKEEEFFPFLQNLSTPLSTSKDPERSSSSIPEVETNKEIHITSMNEEHAISTPIFDDSSDPWPTFVISPSILTHPTQPLANFSPVQPGPIFSDHLSSDQEKELEICLGNLILALKEGEASRAVDDIEQPLPQDSLDAKNPSASSELPPVYTMEQMDNLREKNLRKEKDGQTGDEESTDSGRSDVSGVTSALLGKKNHSHEWKGEEGPMAVDDIEQPLPQDSLDTNNPLSLSLAETYNQVFNANASQSPTDSRRNKVSGVKTRHRKEKDGQMGDEETTDNGRNEVSGVNSDNFSSSSDPPPQYTTEQSFSQAPVNQSINLNASGKNQTEIEKNKISRAQREKLRKKTLREEDLEDCQMRYEEPTDNRKKEPSGIKKKKNLRKEEDAPSGSAIPKEKKEVIDLTLEEIPPPQPYLLQVLEKKVYSCKLTLYSPEGEHMEYTPWFHTKQQLDRIKSLHNRVQERFLDGKPRHMGGNTFVNILTENAWSELSSAPVQEKLKTGPIVIQNQAAPLSSFNKELFYDMLGHGDMAHSLPTEDQSTGEKDLPVKVQALLSSHAEGEAGKSLLAHYFPIDSFPDLERTASSSRIAWNATKGGKLCKDIFTHQDWARWGGAATMGALVEFPMDQDGLCIHLKLRTGKVYLILEDNSSSVKRYEGLVLGPGDRLLFSPIFSVTILCLTSAAWDATAFYCRGSIIDTCTAMFRSFVRGGQSKRRGDALRTFCRYIRYLCHSLTVRLGTEESQLTPTEQGHIPALDTMEGITEIFALLTTTLLLNIIDTQQYGSLSAPISIREKEEISLAQEDALILVVFLSKRIDLVENKTNEPFSVENAFVHYLSQQGRWLVQQLENATHIQKDQVQCKLATGDFLRYMAEARTILKTEIWTDRKEDTTHLDCFTPLNQVIDVGFHKNTEENKKRKSPQNLSNQLSRRRKIV